MLVCFSSYSRADTIGGTKTDIGNISDDGWKHVPLDFTFPFQNGYYTSAYMFSNGVVGFVDPATETTYGLCCDGQNLLDPTNTSNYIYNNTSKRPGLNFKIFGLHTDLKNYGSGKFYTQGDSNGMRFFWENISEYNRPSNLNTFDVAIYPSGNIEIRHQKVNITNHDVTVGITGNFTSDVANYTHYFYHRRTAGGVFWNGIGENPIVVPEGGSICESSPISSTTCPGYAEAFAEQEFLNACTTDPQFDPSCTGYNACTANPQSDSSCPGFVDPNPPVETTTTTTDATVVETAGVDETIAEVIAAPENNIITTVPEVPIVVIEPEVTTTVATSETTTTTEVEVSTPEETVIAEIETEIASVETEAEAEVSTESSTEETTETVESAENTTESSEETVSTSNTTEESKTDSKPAKKKSKAELKREKIKKIITDKLKSLAKDMANASTIEAQQAVQAQINALINFVPGFNAYGRFNIPGITFYTPEPLYAQQKRVPENNRGLLNGLASQILHEKMVDMQYKKIE